MYSIENRVHELYWRDNRNSAHTMLICLSKLFNIRLEQQTLNAAIGLHCAGGLRAQCGLVEGGLMFVGIYCQELGKLKEEIVSACYIYANAFNQKFGSLRCYDLRQIGFTPTAPLHLCEAFTCNAVKFAYQYIKSI